MNFPDITGFKRLLRCLSLFRNQDRIQGKRGKGKVYYVKMITKLIERDKWR